MKTPGSKNIIPFSHPDSTRKMDEVIGALRRAGIAAATADAAHTPDAFRENPDGTGLYRQCRLSCHQGRSKDAYYINRPGGRREKGERRP